MPIPNHQLSLKFFPETKDPSGPPKLFAEASKVQKLWFVCDPEVTVYTETAPILVE